MATPCRVGLLERIAAGEQSLSVSDDRTALLRSVLGNLTRILNAREGAAAAQMELGLPSPHEMLQGFPATLPRALSEIRACIQRFEPRLASVAVRHIKGEPGDLAVRFQINAVLAHDRSPVNLTTAIAGDGRVRVGE